MRTLKVLYIEDNADNRLLVRRVLEARGHRLVEAVDGPSGIEAARGECPDLILMDIMIPRLDGNEVTTRLRGVPYLEKVPIIALTAAVLKDDRERAIAAGCDGYLHKPIDVDRFPEQIERFIAGEREFLTLEQEVRFLREQNRRLAARLEQKSDQIVQITSTKEKLERWSLTDAVTRLPNRRYLARRLREELSLATRFKTTLVCMRVDLDDFKQVNDAFGHAAGNLLLRDVGALLADNRRGYETVGRYGGDEFLVVLPQIDVAAALPIADRIRQRIADTVFLGDNAARITVSIGLAQGGHGGVLTDDQLLHRADQALGRAKALKNHVIADPTR